VAKSTPRKAIKAAPKKAMPFGGKKAAPFKKGGRRSK
jgi:hypothetical protein